MFEIEQISTCGCFVPVAIKLCLSTPRVDFVQFEQIRRGIRQLIIYKDSVFLLLSKEYALSLMAKQNSVRELVI